MAFNKAGEPVLCQHGDRRISRRVGGRFVTLADKYDGKRLNSPNDLAIRSNGDIYFTDPPYGLPKAAGDPAKELEFQSRRQAPRHAGDRRADGERRVR